MRTIRDDVAHERDKLGQPIEAADRYLNGRSDYAANGSRCSVSLTNKAYYSQINTLARELSNLPQGRVTDATASTKQTQIELRDSTVPAIVAA